MVSALVVFASLTGSTEECADIVAESLEALGAQVDVVECSQASASDFQKYDLCLVGSYTYGDGELPDEIVDLYEELAEEDLSGKVFGVFGSGDTYYDHYCQAVILFEEQFGKTGALKGAESVKIELNAEEDDIENLKNLSKQLITSFENK
ncbi:flavodoxin [Granulicatella sp. zg-ZJ]|uniref:flavodoxin n=1 Tax=Granulicatella sp. zg-ZJ TaxID=2678504 RepID=UPI0013D225E5|nr:flavodoxin [Granulicatella sp. zg-ZJ]NEW63176.1 flavodoxin [Granulicatella sp. zg-ZJ]